LEYHLLLSSFVTEQEAAVKSWLSPYCCLALALAFGCLLSGPGIVPLSAQAEVEYLQSENTRAQGLPFSDAVRVGDMLYLSGQIGVRPGEMTVVPGGIQAETRQTMENIKSLLETHGSSMEKVVKCLVMMAEIAEWPSMNEVYVTYFQEHFPARSAFAGTGLAMGARVEIECWATVG
jgi:reactive intermediate/imine deaminase